MQSANEELQSSNEELRSTMEELETSREELQSVNEELQTLNQESRHKVEELAQLSSDLQNLLQATDIATIFLDKSLRILRYTPTVGEIFNVRHSDRGRPLADLTHRMGYTGLIDDARQVLQTLVPVEHELQSDDGRWLLLRVMPYRTMDDHIEGVVVTIVDVTAVKTSELALRASEERHAFLLRLGDALRMLADPAAIEEIAARLLGEYLRVDRAFFARTVRDQSRRYFVLERIFSTPGTPVATGLFPAIADGLAAGELAAGRPLVAAERAGQHPCLPFEGAAALEECGACVLIPMIKNHHLAGVLGVQQLTPREWSADEVALLGEVAERTWVAVDRAQAEADVRRAASYAESIVATLHEPLLVLNSDLRVRTANQAFYTAFATTPQDTEGRLVYDLGNGQWNIPALRTLLEDVLPENHVFNDYEVSHRFEHIGRRVMLLNARQLTDLQLILLGVRDITARKAADDALRASEERHRMIVESARDYAIFTTDAEGVITTWSPGAEAVFGWESQEAIGQRFEVTFTPEDREQGVPAAELATAAEKGVAPDVRWHQRRDGARIFIEGVTRSIVEPAGQLHGFLKIGQDVTERRAMAESLREREALRQLVLAEEAERQRISREMHDSTGQVVTSLLLGLSRLKDSETDAAARASIESLEVMASEIARDVHHLAVELRPAGLDNLGLSASLSGYLQVWSNRHGIAADLHAGGLDGMRLRAEIEITLFRIVQEGLTNILKHAEATRASVVLERQGGEVRMILEDDGRGFDLEAVRADPESSQRLGLRGIHERVGLIGGVAEIESVPGSGTTLYVRIPVDGKGPDDD